MNIIKLVKFSTAFLIMGLALTASTASVPRGESSDGLANLEIMQDIVVRFDRDLNFGVLLPPSGATGIWYMDVKEDGSLEVMGQGTDSSDPDPTDHHLGQFTLFGSTGQVVNFDVDVTTDYSAFGYNLLNLKTLPKSPAVLTSGGLTVLVGGRLQIQHGSPGINGGGEPAVYTLTVNY